MFKQLTLGVVNVLKYWTNLAPHAAKCLIYKHTFVYVLVTCGFCGVFQKSEHVIARNVMSFLKLYSQTQLKM